MKIKLIKLTLLNFKGVRSLDVKFDEVTNIFGENATGKTTVFDAFLWLLFGKDSTDRKTFEIKTLGPDNKPFHRMDHEVSAILDIDGEEIHLKKVYKEKWVKKRGDIEPVFSGHENNFYWNDVPMKEEEYQRKISNLLNENVFKLITNTGYFNSRPWQERRNVLLDIGGAIDDIQILDTIQGKISNENNEALLNAIKQQKNKDFFKGYKAEISAKKKKIKDDMDLIPARIDEATRSLPDLLDYKELEGDLASLQTGFENIDNELLDKSKAQKEKQEALLLKINGLNDLRLQLQKLELSEKNKVQEYKRTREQGILNFKSDLRNKLDEVSRNAKDLSNNASRKTALEIKAQELRNKWSAVNSEQLIFKDNDFSCPACKREFDAAKIEEKKTELTKNFNQDKSTRLAKITTDGQGLKKEILSLDEAITVIKANDATLQDEIKNLQENILKAEQQNTTLSQNESLEIVRNLAKNPEFTTTKEKIVLMEEEVNKPAETDHIQALLLAKKKELVLQMDAVKNQLASKDQREKTEKRITELKDQEKEMGQELARLEGVEYSIEQFTKAKMDELEDRINGRFELVKFKLFSEQINGGQVECCDTLINTNGASVPYPDANNAARIQAGLDIINTLTDHYNVTAPVFIDNRESVVNIPHSKSQVINLIVSAADKKLRVVNGLKETAMAMV